MHERDAQARARAYRTLTDTLADLVSLRPSGPHFAAAFARAQDAILRQMRML